MRVARPEFKDYPEARDFMLANGWKTPDSYANYDPIPDLPGVYVLLCSIVPYKPTVGIIGYVGSSVNLRLRLKNGHEVMARIEADGYFPQKWFKVTAPADRLAVELNFIAEYDPPYNVIGRPRGLG